MIIALEGIDGSGKGTQINLVANHLRNHRYKVATIGFPTYGDGIFAEEVAVYLNGGYGALDSVSPKIAALLYAGNRIEHIDRIRRLDKENDFLLIDRYTYSNVAHQGAKIDSDLEFEEFTLWIENIEFAAYGLPEPTLNILLDIDPELSTDNVSQKPRRDYTSLSHDIHESDENYMKKVAKRYSQLSKARHNWKIVRASSENVMREKDAICLEIVEEILSQ